MNEALEITKLMFEVVVGGCTKWQGASPNCVPGSRVICFTGSGEPGGGQGRGGAEPSPGRAQTRGPWGILAEGLQKQVLSSEDKLWLETED